MICTRRLWWRRLFPRDVRRFRPQPRFGRQLGLFAVARRCDRVRLRQRTRRRLHRPRRPTIPAPVAARIQKVRRWKCLHVEFGPAVGRRIRMLRYRVMRTKAFRAFVAELDAIPHAREDDPEDGAGLRDAGQRPPSHLDGLRGDCSARSIRARRDARLR